MEVVATHRPMKNEDAISPRRVAAICKQMLVSPSEIHKHDREWIRSHPDFRPRRACDISQKPKHAPVSEERSILGFSQRNIVPHEQGITVVATETGRHHVRVEGDEAVTKGVEKIQ